MSMVIRNRVIRQLFPRVPVVLVGLLVAPLVRLVAWVGGVGALSPTHVQDYAMRTYSGRPSSSIRFSTSAAMATGLSQSWGSGCDGRCQVPVVGGLETLPETGAERAVVEGAADLEQQIGPAPGPAHLLRLGHAAVDQEVGRALGQRRADPLPGPVPFGVIDQMGALGA